MTSHVEILTVEKVVVVDVWTVHIVIQHLSHPQAMIDTYRINCGTATFPVYVEESATDDSN